MKSFIALFFLTVVFAVSPAFSLSPAADAVPEIYQNTFEMEVTRAEAPVLVQFDAHWCPFCRKLQPHLLKLYQSGAFGMKVVKINVDENPYLMERFAVKTLPTMVVLYKGEEVTRKTGALEEENLFKWAEGVSKDIFATIPAEKAPPGYRKDNLDLKVFSGDK